MNKIKTLLFGAGEGSKQFQINEKDSREFLAYIDNDTKKHSTNIEGLLVISLNDIINYDYDEIVITTQWVNEVRNQLINDLKIDDSKIITPAKQNLKKTEPFKDVSTLELASEILKTISKYAYEDDVELFVDTGTLLGIVRDNSIMPWDDDIDFAFNLSNADNSSFDIKSWIENKLKNSNLPVNFDITAAADKNNKIVDIAIDFKSDKYNSFRTSINVRENVGKNSIELASLGLYYAPSKYFKKYEIIEWDGVKLKVPNDYENYLSFVYGDWRVVKKSITMTDYQHLGDVSFDDFKNAGFYKL
ncbi:MAG: LicD family protein [Campylobacterota bacterium]|nr:LicD family protein [Campylobacterota bacterium]